MNKLISLKSQLFYHKYEMGIKTIGNKAWGKIQLKILEIFVLDELSQGEI